MKQIRMFGILTIFLLLVAIPSIVNIIMETIPLLSEEMLIEKRNGEHKNHKTKQGTS